jgi:transcription termination factor NusB
VWEKPFRYLVFAAIYQLLFWREQGVENLKLDWEMIQEVSKTEVKVDIIALEKIIEAFRANEIAYTNTLEQYLKTWSKTYPVVKACFFCFMLEHDSLIKQGENEIAKTIVSKYIRLGEDLIGGQNVSLIHAVLSKISDIEPKQDSE